MGSWLAKSCLAIYRVYRDSKSMAEIGVGVDQIGVPLSIGTAEGSFLGIAFGLWELIVLIGYLLSFVLTLVAVSISSCKMPAATASGSMAPYSTPVLAPAINLGNQQGQAAVVNGNIDRLNNFPCEDCPPPAAQPPAANPSSTISAPSGAASPGRSTQAFGANSPGASPPSQQATTSNGGRAGVQNESGGGVVGTDNLEWQLKLQEERLEADPKDWPALIKKDEEIYRQHGVDPCTSGFFPESCQGSNAKGEQQ